MYESARDSTLNNGKLEHNTSSLLSYCKFIVVESFGLGLYPAVTVG